MSLKKFDRSDIIKNTIRSYPKTKFFIYDSKVYYNNKNIESGSFSDDIEGASGSLSLFEYNVDRQGSTSFTGRQQSAVVFTGKNAPVIPYVVKGSSKNFLKSSNRRRVLTETSTPNVINGSGPLQEVQDEYLTANEGDVLTGSTYSLTSSLIRQYMATAGATTTKGVSPLTSSVPTNREYFALKPSLDFYGARSLHYKVQFSGSDVGDWNKDNQSINLLKIPKIFYGTRIDPGSVSLKFFYTGSLAGELKDSKHNGELIQTGPEGSSNSGSVAGVVMYEEGFILLTGSWGLTPPISLSSGSADVSGSWLYFAAGANDGVQIATGNVSSSYHSASFDLSFKGQTDTQVMTMYCHARRGEVNLSNNPTFYEFGQDRISVSSSNIYQENDNYRIKNTVSSSFANYNAEFKKQVYISRIAVYDEDQNLLGIATLSSPVLKEEAQDISFKLKMDF